MTISSMGRSWLLTTVVALGAVLLSRATVVSATERTWDHTEQALFTAVQSSDFPAYIRTLEVGSANYVVFRGNNIERLYLATDADGNGADWTVEQISAQGGLNPAVTTNGQGVFYIVHATADATTTLGTGYKLLFTTNATGSWTTAEISGSDDMWYPQAFMDDNGAVQIWADSVRSTVSDFYTFKYTPSTATMSSATTLATSNSSCGTISTARWSTSAVYNSTTDLGYVFTQCTYIGSGQGLHASIYNMATGTWTVTNLQSGLGSSRAGSSPAAFNDNGTIGVFHAMDATDEVYVSYLSGSTWVHQAVKTQVSPGQLHAVVTDEAILVSAGISGKLYLWTCSKPSSGAVTCSEEEIAWTPDANDNPYTPTVVDQNMLMLENGSPMIAFLDDGIYDLVLGTPAITTTSQQQPFIVSDLKVKKGKLTWDKNSTEGVRYQVAVFKGKKLVKKYKVQSKNYVSLTQLAAVVENKGISRLQLRLAVRLVTDDEKGDWEKTEMTKKAYTQAFAD